MTLIVPAVLGGLAISVMALMSLAASRKARRPRYATQQARARILVHSINDDRCTGCDACVAVCPTNVLDLIDNKSRVLRFQDCIQCEACMWACPTEALVMHVDGTEPPKLKVPELDENYMTAVPGQYLIGEVAGKPLVKNAANIGRAVVGHMLASGLRPGATASRLAEGSDANEITCVDVAIVGSGPGGISAALTCIERGLSYVVLEKEQIIASTVARYPKGKLVMAEPYDTRNLSLLPVFDSSKEEIIPIWQELIERTGLQIRLGEAVEEVSRRSDGVFDVRTTVSAYRAQRVVLATGTRGKPRTLGVPGENLRKVHSLLDDPDEFRGRPVIVIGGGDSACEAAIALADAGARVVLSYRGRQFARAQPKNRSMVESYAAQRRLKVKYQSTVARFDDDTVTLQFADGSQKYYPNEAAFVLIGSDPPIRWLNKLGIEFIERPHTYALGKTDELVARYVRDAAPCPETAAAAAPLVLGERAPEAPMEIPDRQHSSVEVGGSLADMEVHEVTGPRKWIRSATSIFTSARKISQPMPLSEFAKQNRRRHTGHGRRDQLPARERTRVLRMLRDVGGRLADEESRVEMTGVGALDHAEAPLHIDESVPYNKIEPIPGAPRMDAPEFLDDEDSAPKQAVIVGLARAMAKGPRSPRRRPRRSSPPPYTGPRANGTPPSPPPRAAAPPAPPPARGKDRRFVDAATAHARPDTLDALIAETSRPQPPRPPQPRASGDFSDFGGEQEATRALDFDPASFMEKAERPIDVADERPSSPFDSGVFLEDHRAGGEATAAVDMHHLAHLEAQVAAAGGHHRRAPAATGDFHEDPTRVVDASRAPSLSDVDWDLD